MCHHALRHQHQGERLRLLPLSNLESLIQHSHSFLDQVEQLQVLPQLGRLQLTQHSPGVHMQTGSLLLLPMGMLWQQGISVSKQHTMSLQRPAGKQWFQLPV